MPWPGIHNERARTNISINDFLRFRLLVFCMFMRPVGLLSLFCDGKGERKRKYRRTTQYEIIFLMIFAASRTQIERICWRHITDDDEDDNIDEDNIGCTPLINLYVCVRLRFH